MSILAEQLDDCINLLEPVLSLESLDSSGIDSAEWERIDRARKVYENMRRHSGLVDGSEHCRSYVCHGG